MKKILVFAIALASLTLASCQKFLDVIPEGSPTTDSYFTNDAQSENAIKSIYEPIADGDDLYGRDYIWEQCLGTVMVPGRTRDWPELFCMKWNGDESPLRSVFEYCYKFESRANWIVQSLLNKEAKTELTYVENRSLGEAYFMRAFFHYTIAYRYGTGSLGVPAIKYEECNGAYDYSIPPQQASVCDNYAMIIDDLTKAEQRLGSVNSYSTAEKGRACKEGAVAMMARVYAYWATWDKSQWANVISTVDRLQSTYHRSLIANYEDNFNDNITSWWNSEYCWSIPGNGGHITRVGAEFPGVCLVNKGYGVYNGWGQFKPTYDAYEEFLKDGPRDENIRLKRSILAYGDEFMYNGVKMKFYGDQDVETGFQINKWMDPFGHPDFVEAGYVNEAGGSWPSARVNYHVIRFADCLLLRAEAKLATGDAAGAAADINTVRNRAKLASIKGNATWADIYHERICELSYEPMSDHGADLRRWAVSGAAEIKALAIAELEAHPRALFHVYRSFPESPVGQGKDETGNMIELGKVMNPVTGEESMLKGKEYKSIDLLDGKGVGPYPDYVGLEGKWDDHFAVYPYPSQQITKSAGALKQNAGY